MECGRGGARCYAAGGHGPKSQCDPRGTVGSAAGWYRRGRVGVRRGGYVSAPKSRAAVESVGWGGGCAVVGGACVCVLLLSTRAGVSSWF